jgi:plastocyanin
MLLYGLANALEDFWPEQLVKRGTTDARLPSMIRPAVSPEWAARGGSPHPFGAAHRTYTATAPTGRNSMTRRVLVLFLAVSAVALGGAACGGGDDEGGGEPTPAATDGGGGSNLDLATDPGGDLAFDQTELTASAGDVTINLTNDASIPHNVAVEGGGVDEVSDTVTGDSTSLTVTLEAGDYTFYCAVPGHREAGMEGTLKVE